MSSQELENSKASPGFRPLDIATLAYVLLHVVIVLIFMIGQRGWYYSIAFYLSAAGIVGILAKSRTFSNGAGMRLVRLVYPMILFVFFYEGLRPELFSIYRQPLDSHIHSLELALIGSNLSFALQQHMQIWLNEFFSLFYLSYYFLPATAVVLFLVHRKWRMLEEVVLATGITFYVCYLLFVIFPVAGPRIYLHDTFYLPMIGPFFTPLAQRIVSAGGLQGGAMPSSHCAAALVAIWYLAREYHWAAVPLAVELALLCASTVYGRYHYTLDVIAGLVVGAVSIAVASRWQNAFYERTTEPVEMPEAEVRESVKASVPG